MDNIKQLTLKQVIDFLKEYTAWYEAKYPDGPPQTESGPGGDTPPPPPKP